MPTFDAPLADASEATATLRGLAHAARTFESPADTYPVIGELLAGVRSLRQVLDQLTAAHINARARAHDDAGNQAAVATWALAVADELHQAGTLLNTVHKSTRAVGPAVSRARDGADWFTRRPGAASAQGRGLAL